jgi:hypothetical protein
MTIETGVTPETVNQPPRNWRYFVKVTDAAGVVRVQANGLARTKLMPLLKTYRKELNA